MKIPLSWLKEFVDIDLEPSELAKELTLAGLEVEEIRFVGVPLPEGKPGGQEERFNRHETKITGLGWDSEKIVVGAVLEVMPHPDADRLVLCRLDDGDQEHVVLTGAPNLFPYKGKGALDEPLKVAYAREGSRLYDGHKPGWELMTLKRAKIRGVESYSMACSEKELGISEEHEGIIILDADAPVGMPLVDYMGDVVFDITIIPNLARAANILGVAREVSALTGAKLKEPSYDVQWGGPPIEGRVSVEIRNPELNPRFVLGLVEDVSIKPSPYWVQRRLRLVGMRPINNIVDATNYAMLEIGEPLHAFDYDVLLARAGGKPPKIITRLPEPGEKLTTLDDVERSPEDFTVLVADEAGALSIAGVMGGAETEVSEGTTRVLLEGAAWNFINIRRTVASQNLDSEAAYRFARSIHPAMAERGVRQCLEFMRRGSMGIVAEGLVDAYPLPLEDPVVEVTPQDAQRWLGIELEAEEMADLLGRLGFETKVKGEMVTAHTPDHRMDIGDGIIGKADLMEEIARLYGYDQIPETLLDDEIPPQYGNPGLDKEERLRDLLAGLGLQEVVTYRLTSPEREARLIPAGTPAPEQSYVRLKNPSTSDRGVLRRSLLASVLEIVKRNSRVRDRIALYEIGPVFHPSDDDSLPDEPKRLVIALAGTRALPAWQGADLDAMDFYDLKGILEAVASGLHIDKMGFERAENPSFHPGKCAKLTIQGRQAGVFGELHPFVREQFDLPPTPILAAELELDVVLGAIPESRSVAPVWAFPPVLEDLAVVVDDDVPAERVEAAIREAGGALVTDVHLFDLYRGDQVGEGKKSLAYSLVYHAPDRTLTDSEVAKVRKHILKALDKDLKAKLRE